MSTQLQDHAANLMENFCDIHGIMSTGRGNSLIIHVFRLLYVMEDLSSNRTPRNLPTTRTIMTVVWFSNADGCQQHIYKNVSSYTGYSRRVLPRYQQLPSVHITCMLHYQQKFAPTWGEICQNLGWDL